MEAKDNTFQNFVDETVKFLLTNFSAQEQRTALNLMDSMIINEWDCKRNKAQSDLKELQECYEIVTNLKQS